jgi:hypothetical protein
MAAALRGLQELTARSDRDHQHIYSAFLVEEEGTASTFRALLEVFTAKGLPSSLYTDRGSHYFYTPKAGEAVDKDRLTQVGRALDRLGIEHIAARARQAPPLTVFSRQELASADPPRHRMIGRPWQRFVAHSLYVVELGASLSPIALARSVPYMARFATGRIMSDPQNFGLSQPKSGPQIFFATCEIGHTHGRLLRVRRTSWVRRNPLDRGANFFMPGGPAARSTQHPQGQAGAQCDAARQRAGERDGRGRAHGPGKFRGRDTGTHVWHPAGL